MTAGCGWLLALPSRAATKNNLGTALSTLGERTYDQAKFEEALKGAAEGAFDVLMRAGRSYRPYFEELLQAIDRQLAVQ